jgi:hypothetical protein
MDAGIHQFVRENAHVAVLHELRSVANRIPTMSTFMICDCEVQYPAAALIP